MRRVDLVEEIQLRPLVIPRDMLRTRQIKNGCARRPEQCPLVTRRQKTGTPVERPALHTLAVAQHHVTGQVSALASQSVGNPRSRARKTGSGDTGVDLVKGRDVIVRFAVERFDKSKIVYVFRDVWILFANPRSRLAVLLEAERRLH